MNDSVVLAFSGGGDSTVLLYKAIKEFSKVYTISFDYGQRHIRELQCVDFHIKKNPTVDNKIVKLPFLSLFKGCSLTDKTIDVALTKNIMGDPQNNNYFPNRNTIFLSILTGYAESIGCNTVWYGAAQADSVAGFFDGSKEFLQKINEVNALNRRHKIQIGAPLIEMSKKQILQQGIQLGVDFSHTITCYSGEELACGICPSCSLRLAGWSSLKLCDPLKYQIQDKLEEVYKKNNCKAI